MRSFYAFFAALLALGIAFPCNAYAQAFGGDRPAALVFAAPKFGENNPHLKKLMTLQYQMQLLRRMIEREKSVNEMVKSAVEIGVTEPFIPSPERNLCEQVPANLPCSKAYKELYPDFMKEAETRVADALPTTELPGNKSGQILQPLDAEAMKNLPGAVVDLTSDTAMLFWTSVTCMNEKCSAVVTPDPSNPRLRYRIVSGETLPDGTIVEKISANGVTLAQDKKSIVLAPAPKPSDKKNG